MENKKFKPLGNRILVQRNEMKVTRGGILLPDAAKEKPRQGKVLAVGPGKVDEKGNLQPLDIQVGDEVLFSAYSGTEVEEERMILSEDDVLARLV
jgi:chaperonin GroES